MSFLDSPAKGEECQACVRSFIEISPPSFNYYSIEEKIGEGGMGVVYKAKDERLLRTVAIRIISSPLVSDRFFHCTGKCCYLEKLQFLLGKVQPVPYIYIHYDPVIKSRSFPYLRF
jgi:serine/threonine protein kinase